MTPLRDFWRNRRGATAIEFAFTAPLFIGCLFAIVQFCLALYTQSAIQHGAEMAARCAGIGVCGNETAVQNFAVAQSYGLNPPASTFSLAAATCGSLVSAVYTFNYLTSYTGGPSVTLTASSCFPKQS